MITRKIGQYLKQQFKTDIAKLDQKRKDSYLKSNEAKTRLALIKMFKTSKGICSGISLLWVYAKLIADDPSTDKSQETDDIHCFNRMLKLLNDWDGVKPFTHAECNDLNRFISNIIHYQREDITLDFENHWILGFLRVFQDHVSVLLEDTKRGSPQEIYRLNPCAATRTMLKGQLNKVMQPGVMIFINLHIHGTEDYHRVAVYQSLQDKSIYYFDINNDGKPSGYEVEVKDLDELTYQIFDSASPLRFNIMARQRLDPLASATATIGIQKFQFSSDNTLLIDESMGISDDEFTSLLSSYPEQFKPPAGRLAKQIINCLTSQQLLRLLKSNDTSNELKTLLLNAINQSPDQYSIFVNRYVSHHHRDAFSAEKLATIIKRANELIDNDSLWYSKKHYSDINKARTDAAIEWLYAYDNRILNDSDMTLLKLSDAMFLASHRANDQSFIVKLFENCDWTCKATSNEETYMFHNFTKALYSIVASNNIEFAKQIITRVCDRTGLIPSAMVLEGIGNDAITRHVHSLSPHLSAAKTAAIRSAIKRNDVANLKEQLDFYRVGINDQLDMGDTLAHLAINNLSYDVVEFLLHNGADFSKTNSNGFSAIDYFDHACSWHRHDEEQARRIGVYLYQHYPCEAIIITLLKDAIKQDNLLAFQHLLQTFNINNMQFDMGSNDTFAHIAAQHCSLNILKFLVSQNADFTAISYSSTSPLVSVIEQVRNLNEDRKRLEDRLLAADLIISASHSQQNSNNSRGKNPIVSAVSAGFIQVIPLLMQRGYDINGTLNQEPPLWTEALKIHYHHKDDQSLPMTDLMQFLLDNGADIDHALQYAQKVNEESRGEYAKIVEMFNALSVTRNLSAIAAANSQGLFKHSNELISPESRDLTAIIARIDKHLAKLKSPSKMNKLFTNRNDHKIAVLQVAKGLLTGLNTMQDLTDAKLQHPKWNHATGKSTVAELVSEAIEAINGQESPNHSRKF